MSDQKEDKSRRLIHALPMVTFACVFFNINLLADSSITQMILGSLWFFLPAGVSNSGASLCRWVPFLNYPVDFGKTYKGQRICGANKTFRGFLVGTGLAIGTVYLQTLLYPEMKSYCIIDYSQTNFYLLGFLMGFGALAGDAIESFFKRQKNIPPGKSWFPFDQSDWVIGGLILVSFYYILTWQSYLIITFTYILIHPLANLFAYGVGWQKNKF